MNYTLQGYIDSGAQTQRISKKFYKQCELGSGLNTENFEKKFYKQCKLGADPQLDFQFLQAMHVYVSSHQVQS